MLLGILSDPHGRAQTVRRALRILQAVGARAFVICGDVGGAAVLEELAHAAQGSDGQPAAPAWFVWGNTDDPGPLLNARAQTLGLRPPAEVPLRFELAGRHIAVFHGHEPQFSEFVQQVRARGAKSAQAADGVDYVLYGHSHAAHNERVGAIRFINPGALHRAHTHSVATLDVESDLVRFWRVSDADHAPHDPPVELPW